MARESQGLQIALIVFVMLTIILGVTTFLFWKQYDKERERAIAAEDTAAKEKTAATTTLQEIQQLKKYMDVAYTTATLDTISADFNKDFEDYAAGYTEGARSYRSLVKYLHSVNGTLNTSLASEQAARTKLEQDYAATLQSHQTVADQEKARADAAANELTQEKDNYQKSLQAARGQTQSELAKLAEDQKARDTQITGLQAKVEKTKDERDKAVTVARELRTKLEDTKQTYQLPDGKIRWVNQREGTVWIDLGQGDALPRLMSFSVYSADTTNVGGEAADKGKIEVTKVLDEHLAEARIVEDEVSNPIMPGDLIHTVAWAPGQKQHFALNTGIDVNNDGKPDPQLAVSIIQMNGGVVDCYIDDSDPDALKAKPVGAVTGKTAYHVVGTEPEAIAANEPIIKLRTWLDKEAETRGLENITTSQLLKRMGWKNQAPVIHYGPGANPADFAPKPREGVSRVSSGNVSGSFRRRPSPANRPGSAY